MRDAQVLTMALVPTAVLSPALEQSTPSELSRRRLAVDAVCGQVKTMRSIHMLTNSERYAFRASSAGRGAKVDGSSVVGAGDDRRCRGTPRTASSVARRCSDAWSYSACYTMVMSRNSSCCINGDSGGWPFPAVVAQAVAAGAVADGDGAAAEATVAPRACNLASIAAGKGGGERLGSAGGTIPAKAEASPVGPAVGRARRGEKPKPRSRENQGGRADAEECSAKKGERAVVACGRATGVRTVEAGDAGGWQSGRETGGGSNVGRWPAQALQVPVASRRLSGGRADWMAEKRA